MRTVAQKMGISGGERTYLLDPSAQAIRSLHLPEIQRAGRLHGGFDLIIAFMTSQDRMRGRFVPLRKHLRPHGALWICWPKGGQRDTDLSLKKVIALGYDGGLVESTTLSIDAVWSAIKFTHPKPGKTYSNSYGQLPGA